MMDEKKKKGTKLSSFKTDSRKSEEGVWTEVGAGFEIRVARLGNPKYQAELKRLGKPHLHGIRRQGLESEQLKRIQAKATARYLLLDWRGLEDDDGKTIEYSYEKALELFLDPDYNEFLDIVLEAAGDMELFRVETIEDQIKN
jgi:hypothetical protein